MISNPIRFHSRYRLFRKWYDEMSNTQHVIPYIVEVAFGDRPFEVTEANNPRHLQLRTKHELWHKENAINLGVRHLLPLDWKYLCWSDTDIHFRDPAWALEALHQLQHHPVVQPWKTVSDLGFYGNSNQQFESFCSVYRQGVPIQCHPSQPYKYAHSGFAWCCTREFWENTHGLMEWCIVGSADHHMAFGMINRMQDSVHGEMSLGFKRKAQDWQRNAFRATGGNLGFVKGHIEHNFHGPKTKRGYRERWQMFIEHQFDPYVDLYTDSQGLVSLIGKPELQDKIRRYLRARNEDSIEDY